MTMTRNSKIVFWIDIAAVCVGLWFAIRIGRLEWLYAGAILAISASPALMPDKLTVVLASLTAISIPLSNFAGQFGLGIPIALATICTLRGFIQYIWHRKRPVNQTTAERT